MKCKHCGKEIVNDSRFCEHCGATIKENTQREHRTLLIVIGVIVALGIFAFTILAIISHYEDAKKEYPQPQTIVDSDISTNTDTVVVETKPTVVVEKQTSVVVETKPSIIIDKMQVLYAGVSNTVTIDGVDMNKYYVSFPDCDVKKIGSNQYQINVPVSLIGKKVTASIIAKDGTSGAKPIKECEFRVKRVPDPRATIGANIRGGKRSKTELTANPFIRASMGEDFAYDLKWNISSYQVVFVSKGYEDNPETCVGANFSDAVKQKIENAGSGTVIIFTNIKVSSEAGQRAIEEISVRIK